MKYRSKEEEEGDEGDEGEEGKVIRGQILSLKDSSIVISI